MNNFIILTTVYPKFSEQYINRGILEYLIESENGCVNWWTAIESILKSNLSIKFAQTNKLDFKDTIQNGFYASRKPFNDFKILRSIINEDCSPRFPVFFIHFNNEISENFEKSKTSTSSCKLCYSKSPLDVYLPAYVTRIQDRFNEICFEKNSEIERISLFEMKYKLIAELIGL